MNREEDFTPRCPLPMGEYERIVLGHGGGGELTAKLLESIFYPRFSNRYLDERHDAATIEIGGVRVAFTTDSYVVRPLFFPGGDIGKLSVFGTANDLAMCGARPRYISAGFIEEGFETEKLELIARSMERAASSIASILVTGDTKVVEKGKGDGLYINTSGLGEVLAPTPISPAGIREGDGIVLSGDIGRHGVAIIAEREGLSFETSIESDCAPLWGPVEALLEQDIEMHCMRDITRGGLASALVELAEASHLSMVIEEERIPVREDVRGACEILGFDPIHVANEGRFILLVPEPDVERALGLLEKRVPADTKPALIGWVQADRPGRVVMRSALGTRRPVERMSGEQLPRIC